MRIVRLLVFAAVLVVGFPGLVRAQASIAGVVKDTSGAVLPGVTVEASSPALIEKTRSVVADDTGQFRIVDLRPGTYAVTFTLSGFTTIKRDGIELSGSFAATVNAELRVGSINETITVTSEAPIVDVQNGSKQRVLGQEVLTGIPTGRTPLTTAILIPGMNITNQDVGGTNIINTTGGSITIHGGSGNDQRVMIDGLSTANSELAGQASNFLANMGSTQEVAVDYSSGSADQQTGGVRINMIPKEGGNQLKGSLFGTAVNDKFQGNNYTQSLQESGLRTPNSIKLNYDVNPGLGGPLLRDRLWFYGSARWVKTQNYVGGMFYNKNAGIADIWTYDPDLTRPAYLDAYQRSVNLRLTWQANPKNKFSAFVDDQWRCQCANVSATSSPEAAIEIKYPIQRMATFAWTSPVTNRLLFEARGGWRGENYKYNATPTGDPFLTLIHVVEQASVNGAPAGLQYHGGGIGGATFTQPFQNTYGRNFDVMTSVSYVTGAHAFKTGFADTIVVRDESLDDNIYHLSYRFNNGVPNQLTERTTPYQKAQRQPAGIGLFVQDRWTLSQLTLNLGIRYDYLSIYIPAQHLGPAPLVPARNLDLPETQLVNWKDVTPRVTAVYDVFGNGKTALRFGANKYLIAQGVQGTYGDALSPVNRLANFVTRNWSDGNRNFVPDCDLTNPADQNFLATGGDRCFAMADLNFGKPTPSVTVDPSVLNGYGVRPYNWELSAGVQHQIAPRVSIDFGYFRRWYGNFAVTDNRALAASDFSPFNVTAPLDARLPDGGGYTIAGLYDPNKIVAADNYFTSASSYGNQVQRWNGVDLAVNARLRGGLLLQGGISTGRTVTDNCEILAQLPEISPLGLPYCHQVTDFLTQIKFLGSYNLPKVDVAVSGSFQSLPGPQLAANQVVLNAAVRPSLGRDLTGGAANVTVNLVPPGSLFGERLNQLDIRFAKVLKLTGTRASINLDLYNLFNVSTVLTENPSYANATATGWRVPTSILTARFAKISVQFDF
ncbi:MAG: TonB-dependent receptor [Acidobacteriota bacterium]